MQIFIHKLCVRFEVDGLLEKYLYFILSTKVRGLSIPVAIFGTLLIIRKENLSVRHTRENPENSKNLRYVTVLNLLNLFFTEHEVKLAQNFN